MPTFRLLIVDDEPNMLRALERPLCGWSADPDVNWEIATADTVGAALGRLEQIPFDVALSDIRLGEEDGIELLREIKERWPTLK